MPIMLTHDRRGFFTLGGFAVEGFVDRLTEGVPQLLLELAVQRNRLRLMLPLLLQRFDGVDAHHGHGTQCFGLFNHGVTALNTVFLCRLQRCVGGVHRCFPLGLQLGEGFFRHMAQVLPALGQLVQATAQAFPVGVFGHLGGGAGAPDRYLGNQCQTGFTVDGVFSLDLFNPGFHHGVGLVAGVVKTLPQGVVGHATLVGLLPLLAQGAQGFLHFATAQSLAFGAFEQAFSLGNQFFAQLVGTPALPAFQLARRSQRRVGLVFQLVVNQLAVFFQRIAQGIGRARTGFAVAFTDFLL